MVKCMIYVQYARRHYFFLWELISEAKILKKILKNYGLTTSRAVTFTYGLWSTFLINRLTNLTKLKMVICDIAYDI